MVTGRVLAGPISPQPTDTARDNTDGELPVGTRCGTHSTRIIPLNSPNHLLGDSVPMVSGSPTCLTGYAKNAGS